MPSSTEMGRPDVRGSYQVMLRAVGAHLDQQEAERVRLIEDRDAFIAFHYHTGGTARVERFPFDGLLSSGAARPRTRWSRQRSHLSPIGMSGYEDVFRALGYELDEARAEALLVDELADGFLVTYQYLNPTESYLVRKQMAVLGADQLGTMLQAARSRRAQKPTFLRRLAG